MIEKSHDGPTKSRKVREVPLMFEAPEVLEYLEPPADRAALVFPWLPEATAWIARYVKRHWSVKGFHPHRLRHTFATRYSKPEAPSKNSRRSSVTPRWR